MTTTTTNILNTSAVIRAAAALAAAHHAVMPVKPGHVFTFSSIVALRRIEVTK